MKIYGRDTGTQLRLTEKAQKAYDMSFPLTITQYYHHGRTDAAGQIIEAPGLRFDITGVLDYRRLREVEVNQVLENWYDYMERAKQMEGGAQE